MTKAKTKPCICCSHYNGGIPCAKGHKPRMFVGKGLRRVCNDFAVASDDFQTATPKPPSGKRHAFLETVMRIFGMSR